jgi:lysophospholipase L1-like esterase
VRAGLLLVAGAAGVGAIGFAALPDVGGWDLLLSTLLVAVGLLAAAHRRFALDGKGLVIALVASVVALGLVELIARRLPPAPGFPPEEALRMRLSPMDLHLAEVRYGTDAWKEMVCAELYPGSPAPFFDERLRAATSPRRVLHLGDSMIFGTGVAPEQALPSVLGRLEPGVAHINAGIPGTAPDVQLLALRRWLERTRPDLVVLHLFTGNDLDEMDAAYPCCAGGALLRYDGPRPAARCDRPLPGGDRPGRLAFRFAHGPPPQPLRALALVSRAAAHANAGFLALREKLFGDPRPEPRALEHLDAVLGAMQAELEARKVPFVAVVLPLQWALEEPDPKRSEAYSIRARMIEICNRRGIRVLDAWDLFEDAVHRDGAARWFRNEVERDLHFSAEGHALLARWLQPKLDEAMGAATPH